MEELDTQDVLEALQENELSDDEFREHVEKVQEKRKTGYGRDGCKCVAETEIDYRGVTFTIHLVRYFYIRPVNINAEMSRWGNRSIEITSETEVAEAVRTFGWPMKDWFLQFDTRHGVNEGQTIEEMLAYALDQVQTEIDWLHDEAAAEVEQHIEEQREKLQKIQDLVGDGE